MARSSFKPDNGGASCRIGLIVLATDLATEQDFRRALSGHDVQFHSTRVKNLNPCTQENLIKMGPMLADCAALLLPEMPLDVVAYSCTSATIVIGYDAVKAQINAGRPGVPVVTPATAALNAFRDRSIKKIALLTPYIESVGDEMATYFRSNGIDVVQQSHLGFESDVDMAYLPPASIAESAAALSHPDADAVFISCTAIRAMETLQTLEQRLDKPFFSSIQCLLWDALRHGGYSEPLAGVGSLLSQRRSARGDAGRNNTRGS